jgi:hypothetical protein
MQNGEEEGGRKWSDAEGEKTSPDWTPSEPSSEGEEGGEEGTAESGYTLLPQDNEETMLNGVRESYGEEEELEVKETVSPRMTRWLQKQVDDMSSSSGSSKAESTGWARFDDPASSQDSQDWPTSSSTSQDRTVAMQSMATESVEPTSTMEEASVAAIKEAMVGFSLPSSAVPSWARTVPESVWKAELIGGLQQQPNKS